MPREDFAYAHPLRVCWAKLTCVNADPASMKPAPLPGGLLKRIAGNERAAPQA